MIGRITIRIKGLADKTLRQANLGDTCMEYNVVFMCKLHIYNLKSLVIMQRLVYLYLLRRVKVLQRFTKIT